MGRTFPLEFKLKAANYAEINGVKLAAQKFDVDPKSIREWRFLKNPTAETPNGPETAHHSISLDLKLKIIKHAKENGIEAAAKEYNVNPEGIREWCNGRYLKGALIGVPQKNNTTRKYRKKSVINKKCVVKKIENNLVSWILEQQKKNVLVTKPMIKVKALELFKTKYSECQETFEASLTWVQGFLIRKKLNLGCNGVFTSDFKMNVVKHARKNGILTAAKEYNVSPIYVREWYNKPNLNSTKQMTNLLNNCSSIGSRVQRNFSLDFKLNAVEYAKKNGLSAAAKEYNVDRKSISEWCNGRKLKNGLKHIQNKNNENEIDNKKVATQNKVNEKDNKKIATQNKVKENKKDNKKIATQNNVKENEKDNKKVADVDKDNDKMESHLALWIIKHQNNNIIVTKQMIREKALELLEKDHKENFYPSLSWMQRFLKRKKLNLKDNVPSIVQKTKSLSNSSMDSSSSLTKQKSDDACKPRVLSSDLKYDLKETVNNSKINLVRKTMKLKKRRLFNCESSYNSSSCTSNVVNENQIKINESFSVSSKSTSKDSSLTKTEFGKVESGESCSNATVHPMTVQGLIACIAFQTFFNVKQV